MTKPPVQPNELEQVILRALMTAPNNMQEKTINGKTLTVFEVQNYHRIVAAIDQLMKNAEEKK